MIYDGLSAVQKRMAKRFYDLCQQLSEVEEDDEETMDEIKAELYDLSCELPDEVVDATAIRARRDMR